MKEYKVLVDTSVLISSSIYYIIKDFGFPIKHKFYDNSKSLINYFRDNIDRKIGFYTKIIDISSKRVLSNAVKSTIEEVSRNNVNINKERLLETFSIIYSESLRRLEENKEYLIKETTNEDKIESFIGDILHFFNFIVKREVEKKDPKRKFDNINKFVINPLKRYTRKNEIRAESSFYWILKKKFIDSSPDLEDMKILAQTIYFKELYLKQSIEFYFTSTDQHFVEIEKDNKIEDLIPNLIKDRFNVECLKPEKLLKTIKTK